MINELNAYAKELGLEIYDIENVVENKKNIYRITLIRPKSQSDMENGVLCGISVDDCEEFSRLISPILDIHEPLSGEYFLEVSSPGLERKISTLKQFSQSIGENAKIALLQNEKIVGKIVSVNGENIEISIVYINAKESSKYSDWDVGSSVCVNFNEIKKARTYFDWEKSKPGKKKKNN